MGGYLEVVGAHEEVCNARAHDAEDPLVKVLGLALGHRIGNLGLSYACQALDLHQGKGNISTLQATWQLVLLSRRVALTWEHSSWGDSC